MAKTAEEFPNVRALTDVNFTDYEALLIQRPVLEELVHFRKLEALTLIGAVGGPDGLQALKQLPNLRRLDLTSVDLSKGNGEFPVLPQLRTLTIGPRSHATDRLLASIAKLPRLETLVLSLPFGGGSDHSITAEGFRELRPSASLKTIYLSVLNADNVPIPQKPVPTPPLAVGAPPPNNWWQTNLLDTAAMALPGVAIRNSYLFPVRNLGTFCMGAVVLGLFVGAHLAVQRSSTLAWLGPRYLGRPLFIAGAWILSLSTLSALLTSDQDFPLSRTFPLALTLALFGKVVTLIALSPFLPNTVRLVTPMVTYIIVFLPSFVPNAYLDRIGYYDYLRGLNPVGSAVVAGIMVFLLLMLLLVYFPRREYSLSINWVRVFGTGEAVKWPTPSEPSSIRGIQKWLSSPYDHRVEDSLKSDRLKTTRGQIRRWQVANPIGGWVWSMWMLSGMLVTISISYLLPSPIGSGFRSAGIISMTLMNPLLIGIAWRQRKKVFNTELLRPKSRAVFQREIRTAFLWDLMPAYLLGILVLLYVEFSNDIKLSPIDVLSFDAILAPAAILALTAFAAALALIRGIWIFVVLYLFLTSIGFASSTALYLVVHRGDLQMAIAISASVSLVAIAALTWLSSYWRRMELGR
ncbi:hypothetical protein K2X85_20430 [bacterium]|nr:hypothetical protein [bacterium]